MARQTTGLFEAFVVLSRGFIGRECVWTTAITSCLACAGMASTASGASFGVNLIDAGGVVGGSLGSPITWSPANAAYNPGAGSNVPPSRNSVFGLPALEFDSYLAIDPIGPTEPPAGDDINPVFTHEAMGPNSIINPTSPTTVFSLGFLSGIWFNVGANGGFVASGVGPTGLDRMFIAQLTLRPDTSAPTTNGLLVNIKDAGTANTDGELGALRFGAVNATNNAGKWGQSYYLDFVSRPVGPIVNPVVASTSYAIYVVAVPGPGMGGMLGFTAMFAFRRAQRHV